jgi:glycosyltransferase involved in cell wall biosynthesis
VHNGRAVEQVRRLIRELRPVVVHGHSSIGGVVGRVAALRTGVPRVYTPQGLTTNRFGLLVERTIGPLTEQFIAASPSEATVLVTRRVARRGRVTMIPNGIEPEVPPPGPDLRERLGIPADAPIVGTVARLVPQKAPEDFVRVAALVHAADPLVHFVHIGSGSLLGKVRDAVSAAGLTDRFHLVDGVPEAASVLPEFAVFLLTSRFEGAPYTPLEAMRAGIPVVLTDVVGSRDAVESGVSGVLVPAGDVPALAHAVAELLSDPTRARSLGDAGRARVRESFDVATMGREIAGVYARVMAEGRR